jgi:membrane protein
MSRANAISFSFFLSIFPSIIVLFTLIAFTPFYKNFNELIRSTVHELMPGSAEQVVMKTIKDLTTIKRSDLLSVGFVLAIYFSTNGVMSMMSGFEKAYKLTFRRYSLIEKRWISIKLSALLGLLLLATIIFGILGNTILTAVTELFKLRLLEKLGILAMKWLVLIVLLYGSISIIYRLGIPLRKKLPLINPGATLATILSILISIIFSYYVDNFGSYNKVYGSLGALIAFLIWLQFNIFSILLGFELNAAIAINRDLRALKDTDTGQ